MERGAPLFGETAYPGRAHKHRLINKPASQHQHCSITRLQRVPIAAVMAPSSLRSLLLGSLALWPGLAMASQNSTYSQADQLRAQLALMGDRPDGCPPWCVNAIPNPHEVGFLILIYL